MHFKTSFIGGYKRKQVDKVVAQLKENEDMINVKTAILENELGLFKENSQKQIELIQRDLVIRQKAVVDLGLSLDEKNSKINELDSIINLKIKEIDEIQMDKKLAVDNLNEMFNAKIADLEKSHIEELGLLEKSHAEKTRLTESTLNRQLVDMQNEFNKKLQYKEQYETQIRKIGQIYVDAQENSEKLKLDTKQTVLDSINQIFGDLYRTQNQFEAALVPVAQKKMVLRQLSTEMEETIRLLKAKMDRMDQEHDYLVSPFKNLEESKDKIYNHVNKVFAPEDKQAWLTDTKCENNSNYSNINNINNNNNNDTVGRTSSIETISYSDKQIASSPEKAFADYSEQIEALRKNIEKQQEFLSLMESVPKPLAHSEATADCLASESLVSYSTSSVITNTDTHTNQQNSHSNIPKNEGTGLSQNEKNDVDNGEHTLTRYERERAERENYSRCFARLGENASKDALALDSADFDDSTVENQTELLQQDAQNMDKTDCIGNTVSIEKDASEKIIDITESKKNCESPSNLNETATTDGIVQKKLSIKDILNKYANIK